VARRPRKISRHKRHDHMLEFLLADDADIRRPICKKARRSAKERYQLIAEALKREAAASALHAQVH
jgi:hypothetical protein